MGIFLRARMYLVHKKYVVPRGSPFDGMGAAAC
jgi:hypothetical protein